MLGKHMHNCCTTPKILFHCLELCPSMHDSHLQYTSITNVLSLITVALFWANHLHLQPSLMEGTSGKPAGPPQHVQANLYLLIESRLSFHKCCQSNNQPLAQKVATETGYFTTKVSPTYLPNSRCPHHYPCPYKLRKAENSKTKQAYSHMAIVPQRKQDRPKDKHPIQLLEDHAATLAVKSQLSTYIGSSWGILHIALKLA